MKKKMIVLFGRGNIGKTSTLCLLQDLLCGNPLGTQKRDCRKVIEYRNRKVAIASWGDNGDEARRNVEFFKSHEYDIAVTAARTRGATQEIISQYANEAALEVQYIKKSYHEGDQTELNRHCAKDIQKAIDEYINQLERR